MSLEAPDGHGRSRSRSVGGRDRERSTSRAPSRVQSRTPNLYGDQPSQFKYAEPKFEYAEPSAHYASVPQAPDPPSPLGMSGPHSHYTQTPHPQFDNRRRSPEPGAHSGYAQHRPYEHANVHAEYAEYVDPLQYRQQPHPHHDPSLGNHGHGPPPNDPHYAMPGQYQYAETEDRGQQQPPNRPHHTRHVSFNTSGNFNIDVGGGQAAPLQPQYAPPLQPSYVHAQPPMSGRPSLDHKHSAPAGSQPGPEYARPIEYHYAQPDGRISYNYNKPKPQAPAAPLALAPGRKHSEDADVIEVEVQPGGGSLQAPPSPRPGHRQHRLSVSGLAVANLSLGQGGDVPPGSPLLEAYQGTYQTISPMPSPIMLPPKMDGYISDMALSGRASSNEDDDSDDSHHKKKKKEKEKKKSKSKGKSHKHYDAEEDAKYLAEALRHRTPDLEALIDVLPHLTHDEMLELRAEYKNYAKVQGKGINIAKHIKLKLGVGAFGKACYATALGRWESEAYWANFWYQSNTSRRELLIESLMGRTNAEIRSIKAAFSDKRYNDSLEKCMKAELKADKFRTAVLLVLEEKRQEESNYVYGDVVKEDVRRLRDALTARQGGETAMIHIVVTRSDTHMREVLKVYERTYHANFAKEMLRKSTNLVGETLAHILNGIINRPVRDALLLHQALNEESSNKERTDLLISRLVRYHWDRPHLERIKTEFRARYGMELATAVSEGTKGNFGEFCTELVMKR